MANQLNMRATLQDQLSEVSLRLKMKRHLLYIDSIGALNTRERNVMSILINAILLFYIAPQQKTFSQQDFSGSD